MLAVAVCKEGLKDGDNNIHIIFMLGLPEENNQDDNLLIRIYDEMITIAQDKNMRNRIAQAESFPDLLRVLYRQAEH